MLRKLAKVDIAEMEMEAGSSNAGKIVRAQGTAHLPNRFQPRFFGHARPESASRPFSQIEKFCFPGLWVPRRAGYYFGQRSERWLARLHLDICRSKAGIRQGSSCTIQLSFTVRIGRGPGPIWRSSRGLRLFYRQTPSKVLAHRHVQKRDCTWIAVRLPKEGAFHRNSGRINTKHLGGGVSRVRWFVNLWYSR